MYAEDLSIDNLGCSSTRWPRVEACEGVPPRDSGNQRRYSMLSRQQHFRIFADIRLKGTYEYTIASQRQLNQIRTIETINLSYLSAFMIPSKQCYFVRVSVVLLRRDLIMSSCA